MNWLNERRFVLKNIIICFQLDSFVGHVSLILFHFGTCIVSGILGLVLFLQLFQNAPKIFMETIGHVTNPTCFIGEIVSLVHLLTKNMYRNHLNIFIKTFFNTEVYYYSITVFINMMLYFLYLIRERSSLKKGLYLNKDYIKTLKL